MKRTATAFWKGTITEGKGNLSTQSGVLNNAPYSFKTRTGEDAGTNPEELVAAAHAGCFTMSVDMQLSQKGLVPEMLETIAIVDLDMKNLNIEGIHLEIKGKVKNCLQEDFMSIAATAKATCIISKILSVPITMNATLVDE